MTRSDDLSPSVMEQASAWAVRLVGDEATEADFLALEGWLALSPDHVEAYTRAEGLLAALDEDRAALDAALTRAAAATTPTTAAPARRSGSRAPMQGTRSWRWVGGGLAVAAAAAIAVVVAPSLSSHTDVYVTAPGERRTVALADGSTIVMNGASRLTVRLNRQERLVEMASAEAAFDVAHDPSRPFRVTVGESRVEVLGTAFDIRRGQDETRVAVTRGVVRVSDLANPAHNVRLTRGQTVERADDDGVLEVETVAPETAGWRTGRLVYENRPLSEVVADLNRAWPTPIRAVGAAADLRFTGVLALDSQAPEGQASTIRRLEAFLPVTAVQRDGMIELRPR